MGFKTVPVLVKLDRSYIDGLPFPLNSIAGNDVQDGELEDFFKEMYDE